jgi:hypothetical protein
MMTSILIAVAIIVSLGLIGMGLMVQHSLAQARQGLAALAFDLQHFQHQLADLSMRLQRLEQLAGQLEAPLQTSTPERRLN